MSRNFLISKEPKVTGKRQLWSIRWNRLYVSATVWDRVPNGAGGHIPDFRTARDAMEYAQKKFKLEGEFQIYSRGRGSTTYFSYGRV